MRSRQSTLFLAAVLLVVLIEPPSASQAQQDLLAANIDRSISPRDDFFQYANGTWLKENPIPEFQTRFGIWNVASNEIYSQLRRLSEQAAAKPARRGSPEQLVGDFWATGMDSASINQQGLSPLQPDLDRIDNIKSIDDVMDVVAILHRRRIIFDSPRGQQRALFVGRFEQDETNSRRWIYSMAQGGITLGRLAYAPSNAQGAKARDAFRAYLLKTFTRLYNNSVRTAAGVDAVFELESQLAAGSEAASEPRRIRVAELSQLAPAIDWKRYFGRIGVRDIEFVNVRHPRFFQRLDATARTASLDQWKDYLRFWLVRLNAPFLDDETYGDLFTFDSATLTGRPEPQPRWRRIVWLEKNWLCLPLVPLFEQGITAEQTHARYRALGESIREAFKSRIERLDWMSDSTKQHALSKLARLRITVGLPKNPTDFSTMPIRRDAFVLNMIRVAEWFHDQEARRFNAPVDRATLDLHPAIGGDNYYDASNNEVSLPSPFKAPHIADQDLDDAFVYGSTSLGHEIAHAFDSLGREFDADGNKRDWWTAADSAGFDARAKTLIDQYSAFTLVDGLHMDGRTSLAENMADVIGLRVKLDAFKKTEQFKKGARIGGFTPLQRFLLGFAYSQMGHERPESIASRLKGSYAPDRERVNGPLMNLDEFYEAFDVKPGDRMYLPESARVRIW